jgi:hypothetical protein
MVCIFVFGQRLFVLAIIYVKSSTGQHKVIHMKISRLTIYFLFFIYQSFFLLSCSKNESDTSLPLAPQELIVKTESFNKVVLTWSDKSTNERGFKVERKSGVSNFVSIGDVKTNITQFIDSPLIGATSYTYRVFSYNTLGNSSTYSNEVTVKTPRAPGLIAHFTFRNGSGYDSSGNNISLGGGGNAGNFPDRFGDPLGSIRIRTYGTDCGVSRQGPEIGYPVDGTKDYTLSFWFKILDSTKANQTLFDTGLPYNLTSTYNPSSVNVVYNSLGPFNGFSVLGSNNSFTIFNLSSWHNLTVVRSASEIRYYIDGSVKRVQPISTFYSHSDFRFTIGALKVDRPAPKCYEFFNGDIDDIRLYDKQLTPGEVLQLSKN